MNCNVWQCLKEKKVCVSMYMALSISILGMSLLSALANQRNMGEACLFFLFQVIGILLPGAAIFRFIPIKELTTIEKSLVKYVLGYCSNILVYFLVMLLGLKQYTQIVIGIIAVISCVVIVRKKEENEKFKLKENIGICGLLALLFFIFLIVFARKWGLPVTAKEYHGDLMYWIGDAISLKKQFVPIDFRNLSENYKYHYFGAMQISLMCMFTENSAYNIAIFYSYIESVIILGLAVYCFVRRFIKEKKIVFLTIFLILFTTGLEHKSVVTYIWHIYLLPMSYTIAYSLEIIAIILLFIQNKKEKLDKNILIIASICLTICTGMKGPAGAIVLVGIAIMCAYWLLFEKRYKKAIIYGLVSLFCFCAIYLGLLAGREKNYVLQSNSVRVITETVQQARVNQKRNIEVSLINTETVAEAAQETEISQTQNIEESLTNTEVVAEAAQEIEISQTQNIEESSINTEVVLGTVKSEKDIDYFEKMRETAAKIWDKCKYMLHEIIACAKYYIACNPWTFAPAIIYLFFSVVCKKSGIEDMVLAGMIFVGTFLGYFVDYYGASQMYFSLSVFQFGGLLAGKMWEELDGVLNKTKIPVKWKEMLVSVGLVVLCVVSFRKSLEWEYDKESMKFFREGVYNEQHSVEAIGYHQNILMKEEYEAFEWIRNNTEDDCLILSDRMLENGRFCYLPGAFTERYIYRYNGDELLRGKAFYNGDIESQQYYIDIGVEYVTVTKRISPDFSDSTERLSKVYENEEVSVYKIL